MRPVLCLLPSPLLGPACWLPVGNYLTGGGWEAAGVPPARRAPRTGGDVMATFLAAIPADRDAVLVAHSNAGLFVPLLAESRPRVTGYVFVDATVPRSGAERMPMVPASFYDTIAGLADDDGLLPVWTAWWGADDLSGLFPDDKTRAEVEAGQQRLPLSYFTGSVPVPPGWPMRRGHTWRLARGTPANSRRPARSAGRRAPWPASTCTCS